MATDVDHDPQPQQRFRPGRPCIFCGLPADDSKWWVCPGCRARLAREQRQRPAPGSIYCDHCGRRFAAGPAKS